MAYFDHETKYYKLSDETVIKLKFRDTAFGNGKFTKLYFKEYSRSDCIILIYSIKDKESFDKCTFFSDKISKSCGNNKKVLLLGNKNDEENLRKVSFEEGKNFAKSNDYEFLEISCAKNINIVEAMETAINLGLEAV